MYYILSTAVLFAIAYQARISQLAITQYSPRSKVLSSTNLVTIAKPATQALQLCAAVLSHPNTNDPVEALMQLSQSLQSITQTCQTAADEGQAEERAKMEKAIQKQLVPIILKYATREGIDINTMPRVKKMTLTQTCTYIRKELPDLVPKLQQCFPELTLIVGELMR